MGLVLKHVVDGGGWNERVLQATDREHRKTVRDLAKEPRELPLETRSIKAQGESRDKSADNAVFHSKLMRVQIPCATGQMNEWPAITDECGDVLGMPARNRFERAVRWHGERVDDLRSWGRVENRLDLLGPDVASAEPEIAGDRQAFMRPDAVEIEIETDSVVSESVDHADMPEDTALATTVIVNEDNRLSMTTLLLLRRDQLAGEGKAGGSSH